MIGFHKGVIKKDHRMNTWLNLLGDTLRNPDRCQCAVAYYLYNHQIMTIEIREKEENNDDQIYYLNFEGVIYFAGPLHWTGALFRRSASEACFELLKQLNLVTNDSDEISKWAFTLYETLYSPTISILMPTVSKGVFGRENYAKNWMIDLFNKR